MNEQTQATQPSDVQNSTNQKPYNIEPNIEAMLAYLLMPFTGIAILFFEKNNKFVRFHAMQATILGLAAIIGWTASSLLVVVIIGVILYPVVSILTFVAWVIGMYKAFSNEEYMLPYIGQLAKKQLEKQA